MTDNFEKIEIVSFDKVKKRVQAKSTDYFSQFNPKPLPPLRNLCPRPMTKSIKNCSIGSLPSYQRTTLNYVSQPSLSPINKDNFESSRLVPPRHQKDSDQKLPEALRTDEPASGARDELLQAIARQRGFSEQPRIRYLLVDAVLRTQISSKQTESILIAYVQEYLQCGSCRRKNTCFVRDESVKLWMLVCLDCKSSRSVPNLRGADRNFQDYLRESEDSGFKCEVEVLPKY